MSIPPSEPVEAGSDLRRDAPVVSDMVIPDQHLDHAPEWYPWVYDFGRFPDLNLGMCRDSAAPSASSDFAASLAVEPKVLWKIKLVAARTAVRDIVVDSAGRLYVATGSEGIFAVSSEGKVLWHLPWPAPDYIDWAPILVGDLLVFGTRSGVVRAVDTGGKLRWSRPLDGPFEYTTDAPVSAAAVGKGNTIQVGGGDRKLYTLDLAGNVLQRVPVAGRAANTLISVDQQGVAYFAPQLAGQYAIAPSGATQWIVGFGKVSMGISLLTSRGAVVNWHWDDQTRRYDTFSLDRACGAKRWSVVTEGSCSIEAPAGTLLCAGIAGEHGEPARAFALSPEGKELWSAELENSVTPKHMQWGGFGPLGADGTLYTFINNDGSLSHGEPQIRAYDSATGKVRWTLPLPELELFFGAALLPDGKLIFAARGRNFVPDETYLVAVQTPSPGMARSGWPRLSHDNQNTMSLATPL